MRGCARTRARGCSLTLPNRCVRPRVSQLDADSFPELCEKFQLESVPAFLFLHEGALADSVMGADVPSLVNKVKQHNLSASIAKPDSKLPAATPSALSLGLHRPTFRVRVWVWV